MAQFYKQEAKNLTEAVVVLGFLKGVSSLLKSCILRQPEVKDYKREKTMKNVINLYTPFAATLIHSHREIETIMIMMNVNNKQKSK